MNEFMSLAKKEAEKGIKLNDGGPFGAVIIKDGVVISSAHNEVLSSNDPTAHAEVLAIRRASVYLNTHILSGCELYTTCEPCPMCLSAIFWAGIRTVYYGNNRDDASNIGFGDKKLYEMFKCETNQYIDLVNIDKKYTIVTFNEWEKKEDKRLY